MANLIARLCEQVASPVNVLFFALLLGTALLYTRRWKLGRGILAALALGMAGLIVMPVDVYLGNVLENRFAPPPAPDHVDGIVVLGGAVNIALSLNRHRPSLNGAAERNTELVSLLHRFPQAPVIFSGGAADPFDQSHKEADIVRRWLADMGEDPARVTFENQSRNTRENAVFSKALAQPLPGQVWLVVTSAMHMPRSVASFRGVDWAVTPWPVNYETFSNQRLVGGFKLFQPHRLEILHNCLHEWIGLLYYRLRGWSTSLFPSP